MEQAFRQHLHEWQWQEKTRVLVAVSGGVDSMVLLRLLERLPKTLKPQIGVAHFNHQLREVADQEACALKKYCQARKIPYYQKVWEKPSQTNVEHQARQARYAFLFEIYHAYDYDYLLTAHHADDQAETILMKLIKGSSLRNFEGIRQWSRREKVTLIRPLLAFNKADLVAFAKKENVPFWEDETNHSLTYLRNRIRQQVLPLLARENKDYAQKINQLAKDITLANQALVELLGPTYEKVVQVENNHNYLDVTLFLQESQAVQHQLLQLFVQEELIEKGGSLQRVQLQAIEKMMLKPGNQLYQLAEGWWAKKNYGKFNFYQEGAKTPRLQCLPMTITEQGTYHFSEGQSFILNALPVEGINEKSDAMALKIPSRLFPLSIRTIKDGDRFVLNSSGQTKKVSRLFIDQKIPKEQRQMIPLVVDNQENVLWIVGFRKSYLSIIDETDKIFYKLTYYG